MADLEKDTLSEEVKSEKAPEEIKQKTEKAASKKEKKKGDKKNFFAKLAEKTKKFFKDYKSEMKKIVWCSKKMTLQYTLLVLVCIVIVGAFIGALDVVFSTVLDFLAKLV